MYTIKRICEWGFFPSFLRLLFSSMMLDRGCDSAILVLSLISVGSFQYFTKYDECYSYKYNLSDSGSPYLILVCKDFYPKWLLNFIKLFFWLYDIFLFYPVNVMNCIPALNPFACDVLSFLYVAGSLFEYFVQDI